MNLHYDAATDSLCIDLADRPGVDSDEVADGVVLDFDADGHLVGIDIENASKRVNLQQLELDRLPSTVETIAAA
ncbi:MAG: DUF2283 domain-containing protein [Gammaproteobacteria bacterium]